VNSSEQKKETSGDVVPISQVKRITSSRHLDEMEPPPDLVLRDETHISSTETIEGRVERSQTRKIALKVNSFFLAKCIIGLGAILVLIKLWSKL
jgi:hypothetical protein